VAVGKSERELDALGVWWRPRQRNSRRSARIQKRNGK
jgi:hypothetical protein